MTPGLLLDLAGIAGFCLIVGGTWMIYPPAAIIAAGVGLLAGAIFITRSEEPESE